MMTMDEIIEDFVAESAEDFIGLWEVVGAAEEIIAETQAGDTTESDVRKITLEVVRKMLSRGFFPGEMATSGRALEPWPEQEPDAIIRRIEA